MEKSESKKCVEMAQYAAEGLMAGLNAEPDPQIVNAIQKMTQEANKMENKIYNDDVERIVNDPERVAVINERYHNRQMQKQRKKLIDGCVYATFTVVFGLLGCVGLMATWLAFPVFAACGLYSAFCFGRYFENGKCWGWK